MTGRWEQNDGPGYWRRPLNEEIEFVTWAGSILQHAMHELRRLTVAAVL